MRRIWTPSLIAITPPSLFSAREIAAYENEILANPSATETDASRFFMHYPKFLHLGTGAEVRREVVLVNESGKPKQRVDFFRRSYGSTFWDIIELKDPQKALVVSPDGLHPHLTAEVEKAINQALDYRDLIEQDGSVRAHLLKKGIWICRPQILVVAGKKPDGLSPELLQILYDRIRQRGPIEAWSYTDIHEFAKEHYERNKIVLIPSTHLADSEVISKDIAWEYLIDRLVEDPKALHGLSPSEFEALIAQVLEAFGYEVSMTARANDGGRDLIAVQSGPLARTKFIVECKRYGGERKVGVQQVRAMVGALQMERATGGVIATTGRFTKEAKALLSDERWLIQGKDFDDLVDWLKQYEELIRGRGGNLL